MRPQQQDLFNQYISRLHDSVFENLTWPVLDFEDTSYKTVLGKQLICWGNIHLGAEPPDNFVEWLDEASKITGAYTATECRDAADKFLYETKRDAQRELF